MMRKFWTSLLLALLTMSILVTMVNADPGVSDDEDVVKPPVIITTTSTSTSVNP